MVANPHIVKPSRQNGLVLLALERIKSYAEVARVESVCPRECCFACFSKFELCGGPVPKSKMKKVQCHLLLASHAPQDHLLHFSPYLN